MRMKNATDERPGPLLEHLEPRVLLTGGIPGAFADLDGDGFIGQSDLDVVLGCWGQQVTAGTQGDPSGDGFVGQTDLDIVLDNWGVTLPGEIHGRLPGPSVCILMCLNHSPS